MQEANSLKQRTSKAKNWQLNLHCHLAGDHWSIFVRNHSWPDGFIKGYS
jgi:hypothetical protein